MTAPSDFKTFIPPLLSLTGLFFLNFLTRIILSPFLVYIRQDFDLSIAQSGELFLLLSLGYSIGLFGSAFISSQINHRTVVIISALGVGAALCIAALSVSILQLRACLLVTGLFGGLYFPSGFALLTSMVVPAHWGKAIAIHEIAPNLSFVTAPLLAELFIRTGLGWRWMLVLVGLYAFLAFVMFVRICRCGEEKTEKPNPSTYKQVARKPAFWALLVFFSLAVGSTQGVFAQTPMYLITSTSINPDWVNYLLSISRISGIFLVFWAGYMVDTLGVRRSLFIFMGLTGLCTMGLGVLGGSLLIAAVIIQPTMASCYFPAGFAALSKSFSAGMRPIAISLIIPTAVLVGGGVIPTVLGYFGDKDMFGTGFMLLGAVICLSVAAIRMLPVDE
ncbi:MFS transporter [Desulfonatronovibrio magnus]|uniref:MFS transporter n=1 Tax=Desulfonatronovibrio magnus TaxID=698827 RepID=UPI0005EBA1C3|nr:MFS transporter [Desulfonatronovibrio magnus]